MLSQRLFDRGINVQPVMHPAVPARASRLRFFLTATHTDEDMAAAVEATAEELHTIRTKVLAPAESA
jgi:8-amino-7-oxononanoate synthase